MRSFTVSLAAFLQLGQAAQIPLGGEYSPFSTKFDDLVAYELERWHIPGKWHISASYMHHANVWYIGLAVAVVKDGEIYPKGYGIATFPDTEVTPSTLFYPGSTTKAFTAAAASIVIDDLANSSKPLRWDTPLFSILGEDFVMQDDHATMHTTIEDGLSHRHGVPRHEMSYGGSNFTVRDMARILRHLPMTAAPRTKFQYCNVMYATVSLAIETLTGKWLGDILRERIWEPLGMDQTFFSLSHAIDATKDGSTHLAHGYAWNNKTQEYIQLPWFNDPSISGAGNIISNVVDYGKWLRMLLAKASPLSEAGYRELFRPRIFEQSGPPPPWLVTEEGYALGWTVTNYRSVRMLSHTGGLPGFGAHVAFLPALGWGVVMMGNIGEVSNWAEYTLVHWLVDELLGTPAKERFDFDAYFQNKIDTGRKEVENSRERLFPHAPEPDQRLPHGLPLDAYAGSYYHPGYRDLTFDVVDGKLHTEANRTWAFALDLEHVSGEFFVAFVHGVAGSLTESITNMMGLKTEFRLGVSKTVEAVGFGMEPTMEDELIWFSKVQD